MPRRSGVEVAAGKVAELSLRLPVRIARWSEASRSAQRPGSQRPRLEFGGKTTIPLSGRLGILAQSARSGFQRSTARDGIVRLSLNRPKPTPAVRPRFGRFGRATRWPRSTFPRDMLPHFGRMFVISSVRAIRRGRHRKSVQASSASRRRANETRVLIIPWSQVRVLAGPPSSIEFIALRH
jgi:hypothetical protein